MGGVGEREQRWNGRGGEREQRGVGGVGAVGEGGGTAFKFLEHGYLKTHAQEVRTNS